MSQIIRRPSPLFPGLSEMHEAVDRMFEPATWLEHNNWFSNVLTSNWIPTVDLKEERDQYVISADIPGVDSKNIDISMENGMLTIKGHKETEIKEERENYLHIERSQGYFYRTIHLPNAIDSANIQAKTNNGVLEIIIPKTQEGKSHKIPIKEE